jgi:hypothetical protein
VKQEELIDGFVQLGALMKCLGESQEWKDYSVGVTEDEYLKLQTIINRQVSYNGWFTKENVKESLLALSGWLSKDGLSTWSANYDFNDNPKRVGIIMAGNIPLVGFHDLLCVLMSGNLASCKLSSDDSTLLPALVGHLVEFVPDLNQRVSFSTGRIGDIDAVIATGSDNSLKYFEQYFGKYPHIFRKNRTSIAVLDGNETEDELKSLGRDVFSYFGLGCRNVSHLVVPENYDLDKFFKGIYEEGEVVHNNKYGNNYDYNKAVYLMNQHKLLDNNFVLLLESDLLFSPLAMLHYHYYSNEKDVENYISDNKDQIQVVVGHNYTPFGKAQSPSLMDYADGVDVMSWLNNLK